jgi:hypothetical protein
MLKHELSICGTPTQGLRWGGRGATSRATVQLRFSPWFPHQYFSKGKIVGGSNTPCVFLGLKSQNMNLYVIRDAGGGQG